MVNDFKELIVWKQGHQLVLEVYKVTRLFPREEMYSLVDQLRRAAISVTSNIAEGFSRRSTKERVQFYSMSIGSLSEIENQLLIGKDLGYFSEAKYTELTAMVLSVKRLMSRLISSTKLTT